MSVQRAGYFQVIEGLATSNTYEVKYLYSGNQKLAMIRTENGQEKTYYFINNAQGTPVIMIDTNNMVVSKINLDEFGNLGPSIKLNANANEINFTGKKRDPETGLFYFNQRHYDPEIGRFLTEDPAGQRLNPYLYAANSPLVYVDPDGEFWWFVGMVIGAVAANWGKDLSRQNMLSETLLGAAIGAAAGFGLDTALANGWLSSVTMEARAGLTGSQYASIGLTQTQQAISLGGSILGAGYTLYSVATPLFKEQHGPGYGAYNPSTERYPVVVQKSLVPGGWFDTNIIDPMAGHTQIIEPGFKSDGITLDPDNRKSWSFGGVNQDDRNGLMEKEDLSKYEGNRILYRFTDVEKYKTAKAAVQPVYENQLYNFENFKCHNPVRDMINATR
ncbi:MAG: RHS repeat domain-containing protein [Candidatus Margulisiibacteriota bacterium]